MRPPRTFHIPYSIPPIPTPHLARASPNSNNAPVTTYLLKTEPGDYSYDDLERDKSTVWDGVANNAALLHMRAVKKGDEAYIYHTGNERAIVGLAAITSDPYPDPNEDDEKLVVFDVRAKKRAKNPVTLADIKADNRFSDFALVKQGRLSAMPVPKKLDELLRSMLF
ncbi:MAG: EVE domain-containing protein [Phycisphaeraceae bacterium]|nr:MAG: EVE domain-containing protein [Phycisphaeraceae bacterium]